MNPTWETQYGGQAPRAGGALRREQARLHRDEVVLASSAAGGTTPITARFRIAIPSSRLRVKIAIGFWGEGGSAPDITGSTVTTLTPYVLDKAGNESPMDPTISGGSEQLPFAADLATAADGFHAVLDLVRPAGAFAGYFKAVATWEPTNEMTPEQWESIKGECIIALESPRGQAIGA